MAEREVYARRATANIGQKYFEWMVRLVAYPRYTKGRTYNKLMRLLHRTEFTYILPMDKSRADDGTDLRYRFAYENGYSADDIRQTIDTRPCSVLEMMVALAHRCEESIMDDPDSGNRTGKWFFEMVESLCLDYMDDSRFNGSFATAAVSCFLKRRYADDGHGGLFTVRKPPYDMPRMEIWYQMMRYLIELTDEGGE